ncbi:MAG: hypothetical protein RBS07_07755 [Lentimicrobium sp.]|nr:hypothetical protein [Lentimicrobium sp.]
MFKFISLIFALLLNTVVGSTVAGAAGFDPLGGAILANLVSLVPIGGNYLFAKLTTEVWLSDIMEGFIPDRSFLSAASNMDQFVDNDKINLAEAGVDPNVLINNSTYPVPFAERPDTPLEIVLDVYDTEGTVLRNAELVELAYDKRQSVSAGHKNALLNMFARRAAHAYAPQTDSLFTPVIQTTGAASGGLKVLTFEDLLTLKSRYDELDAPEDRILVLSPTHYNQLTRQDLTLMKAIMQGKEPLFGFRLFTFSKNPRYNRTTGAKVAFNAASTPATDTVASISFVGSEVMRAQGTFKMFERLNDPEQKGDIINFQMRGIALPKRNKMIASVYSGPA